MSLGTPGISEAGHVNTSRFPQGKKDERFLVLGPKFGVDVHDLGRILQTDPDLLRPRIAWKGAELVTSLMVVLVE